MIIELYGLPGSGKSALAAVLERTHGFTVIRIKHVSELVFYNIIYAFKHPIRCIVTVWYLIAYAGGWRLFYYKFMNIFLHHNAKYQKALRYKKAVIDQGYFQNIISLFEYIVPSSLLERYCRNLLYPDYLIMLDASVQTRTERMTLRGHAPRREHGDAYISRWKESVEKNDASFRGIISHLPFSIFAVQTDGRNINDVVADVVQRLHL